MAIPVINITSQPPTKRWCFEKAPSTINCPVKLECRQHNVSTMQSNPSQKMRLHHKTDCQWQLQCIQVAVLFDFGARNFPNVGCIQRHHFTCDTRTCSQNDKKELPFLQKDSDPNIFVPSQDVQCVTEIAVKLLYRQNCPAPARLYYHKLALFLHIFCASLRSSSY